MQLYIHKYKNEITAFSFVLIILAFILSGNLRSGLLISATVIAGLPIAIKAYQAIKFKSFSIEMLVTIAVIGALFIGEYVESAIVTFLFLFGDYLEGRTLEKTRSSLKELIDMAPDEAVLIREGKNVNVSIDEISVGDRLAIYSGAKIAVDGKVVKGDAFVNEATITGESKVVEKQFNHTVYSGTIVDSGYIEVMAEKVGDDTTFAKIIDLVENAQESKSNTEKFLNKFANIYTPLVVILSLLVFLIMRDLHIAITFLVIACPGALVIGAPVSNVAGIGNGAKNGVLIKGGDVMDRFSKVDTVVFDKTGTLTKGKPTVTDIKIFSSVDENELLKYVAQGEMISEHHLGKTIVKEAERRGLILTDQIEHGEVIKGHGIVATISRQNFIIGNRTLMKDRQIMIKENIELYAVQQEKEGNTAIFVAVDEKVVAIISIADEIRDDAHVALRELRKYGVRKMIMLTGDNEHTARLVSRKLALDDFYAELLPEEKVQHIERLKAKGHVVAMAGDGINDAPAIARADIGIAMGEAGTDISMETADLVLMADKLKQFSHAYSLSKASIRNMKQNTFFAVAIVFILLIGVIQGHVHLASGMFIHEASVLIVILNGMRLITFKPHKIKRKLRKAATS